MKRLAVVAATALALSTAATAQIWIMSNGGMGGGSFSTGPPPTCSNSLDFTQACNSGYLVGLL